MLTNEDRKRILNSVLETIVGISDKEYQKRVWIRGEGPEVDDFDETRCFFFDDGDPLLENYKAFGLSETQYHLLKKFRDKFRIFSDKHNWPPEFIDTPEWDQITRMAKEVLVAFDYKKNSNDHKFSWADTVVVKKDAPKQFHPNAIVSVCSLEQAKTPDDAKKYHCSLNEWLYKVEITAGNSFIVPERYLEPFVQCHKACEP